MHKRVNVIKLVWHNRVHRIENNAINNRYKATEANQLKSLSIFFSPHIFSGENAAVFSRPLSRFIASEKKEGKHNSKGGQGRRFSYDL